MAVAYAVTELAEVVEATELLRDAVTHTHIRNLK
jgi:hypothetical protein